MWPSKAENAILKVEQVDAVSTNDDGTHIWKLHWELCAGSRKHAKDITISEPFRSDEYDEVTKYLDHALDKDWFTQDNADEVSRKIDAYRKSLFKKLKLGDYVGALRGRCLDVHVWPHSSKDRGPRSIHSIQWEHLEDCGLWAEDSQKGIQSVTVCRHVHVHVKNCRKTPPERYSKNLTQARDGTFDVLLVVARPHIHMEPWEPLEDPGILNPGTIRGVLLELQEELSSTDSEQQMRLEIVRPGCLKELKRHLEERKTESGKRPYDVVHLDVHGSLVKEKAFLVFNKDNSRSHILGTESVCASQMAELLYSHAIDCVILSACKTAVAHAGPSANLSSVFLKQGISTVVAMSHNMHDSVSKRFYSKFYSELLLRHASLSTAARKARKDLFDHRERWSFAKDEYLIMQDWFVPVVYTSSEKSYRFFSHRRWFNGTLFGTIPAVELWFPLIALIFIYLLVSGRLCTWLEYGAVCCLQPSITISKSHMSIMIVAPLFWPLLKIIRNRRRCWRIRQQLRVLAEDRKNALRIEGDLKKKKMVFFHSKKDVEEDARPFLHCLATIWERTNFVAYAGAIDAEWFVQPCDLTFQDDWKLWVRACTNYVRMWAYELKRRRISSTKDVNSVIIIEKLDFLYPDAEVLKEMQYYTFAQRRLESWLQTHLAGPGAPYLMLTALNGGRALGKDVSTWLKDGPGRCGVLESPAMTVFVRTPQKQAGPMNPTDDEDKWYDWGMRWFCGNVTRPPKRGLISALWDLLGALVEGFVYRTYSNMKEHIERWANLRKSQNAKC